MCWTASPHVPDSSAERVSSLSLSGRVDVHAKASQESPVDKKDIHTEPAQTSHKSGNQNSESCIIPEESAEVENDVSTPDRSQPDKVSHGISQVLSSFRILAISYFV